MIIWLIEYLIKGIFLIVEVNIVVMLYGLIDLNKFRFELNFKNLGLIFVYGLNNNVCLLLI